MSCFCIVGKYLGHILLNTALVLLQAISSKMNDPGKGKRKFSSFFKSLVIELDKDLYGPDNHLVEVSQTSYCENKPFPNPNYRCLLMPP